MKSGRAQRRVEGLAEAEGSMAAGPAAQSEGPAAAVSRLRSWCACACAFLLLEGLGS